MREGPLTYAGLVATNSIRGGANRRVLDAILKEGKIFDAWDDEPWVVKGVAARASLICFNKDREDQQSRLDGMPVERIASDLTGSRSDLTTARPLTENKASPLWATPREGRSTSRANWRGNGFNCR